MVKDELNLKLFRAIQDRDLEAAQEAIDLGANVNWNFTGTDVWTTYLVSDGRVINFSDGEGRLLEDMKDDPNVSFYEFKTPALFYAIKQQDLRMINLLLANGANTDCKEIITFTNGPEKGKKEAITLETYLKEYGLDIKKSLIGGKAKVTISKKLIKDAKKILKNQKMEKNVQVSNGVDLTKYVSDEPYGGRLYHRWVAPFEESKNPIRDLKKSIKEQTKVDNQKREIRQRDL